MQKTRLIPDIINAVSDYNADTGKTTILATTQSSEAQSVINGSSFNASRIFNVSSAIPLYLLFENPTGSGKQFELVKRFLKTFSAGCYISVLWDYDVSTATKTQIVAYNENNAYRGVIDSAMEISVLNSVDVDATTGFITPLDNAIIIDEGSLREPDFISESGVGSNTTGDIDNVNGFRLYEPGTGFLIKVESLGNNNLIHLGYSWSES